MEKEMDSIMKRFDKQYILTEEEQVEAFVKKHNLRKSLITTKSTVKKKTKPIMSTPIPRVSPELMRKIWRDVELEQSVDALTNTVKKSRI